MNLGFMQKWPKNLGLIDSRTFFVEKILIGLLKNSLIRRIDYVDILEEFRSRFNRNWDVKPDLRAKLHTIRRDEKNKWHAGRKIHFLINSRTKDRFQFGPVVECVHVQSIEIVNSSVVVDGKVLSNEKLYELAINDGFETVLDFLTYFQHGFRGKIIHWTNLKY